MGAGFDPMTTKTKISGQQTNINQQGEWDMISVTVVVENTVLYDNLLAEHGLSLWLETPDGFLLYDTGAGKALIPNLAALGLDPLNLSGVVLSHGHYDHSGGLADLLALRHDQGISTSVWCHADVFASHLSIKSGECLGVGPPLGDKSTYEARGAEFRFINGTFCPLPRITLLAPIERVTDFEGPTSDLLAEEGEQIVSDPLNDDLAILVEGETGLTVLTGCAHCGVVNLLLAVERVKGVKPVMLIGGTHMGSIAAAQRDKAVIEMKGRPELTVVAGHCTGFPAQQLLSTELGERALSLSAGMVFEL